MTTARASGRLTPDRLPLRPLSTCARRPRRAHESRRDDGLVTVEQSVELGLGKESDRETGLRAIAVTAPSSR
jgi:hypothetical protein